MQVANEFIKYFEALKYKSNPPLSLIQEKIKTSFLFSVGYIDVLHNLNSPSSVKNNIITIQRCFRHFDLDKISDGEHLSLFSMAGALKIIDGDCYSEYELIYKLITQQYKIAENNIYISYFAGDSVNGILLKPDDISYNNWVRIGVPEKNIIRGNFNTNFWMEGANSGESKSGICGPHTEIFVCVGHFDCHPSQLTHFVEVANLVKIEHRINFSEKKLDNLPFKLFELGLGIERIEMVMMNEKHITNTSKFLGVKDLVLNNSNKGLVKQNAESFMILLDHLRALVHLISDGAIPGPKGRNFIIRKMIRTIKLCSSYLEFNLSDNLGNIIETFANSDYKLNPNIYTNQDVIKNTLSKELKRANYK